MGFRGFRRHDSALLLASVVTVASFLAATIYTQHQLVQLDAVSTTIQTNAVPSVEFLARAITSLNRFREVLEDGRRRGPQEAGAARQALRMFEESVDKYLRLSPLPGEERLWRTLRDDVDRARGVAEAALAALEAGDRQRFAATLDSAVDPAFEKAIAAMWDTFRFDIRHSERLAQEVRDLRTSTRNTVTVLNLLATLVAMTAASIAFQASRRHDRLVEAHRALLADRVTELDRFAGRVAHDILSPLGTIAFSLQMLVDARGSSPGPHIGRAQRALQRVQQLVDGLLTFARSAARSRGGEQCALDAVFENVEADCAEAAHAGGVDLRIPRSTGVHLACSLGVATSIFENLVRNAVKYIGERPVRRVEIRAVRRGHLVRVEVEDTGAGIPVEIQDTLFEPFVRGHEQGSGIGLGLATVKRLVEAHGGAVTVRSRAGEGSTFSVDLPLAAAVSAPQPASAQPVDSRS